MTRANLLIVQRGGPTAVFNASLACILSEAKLQPGFGQVYGCRFGMQGLASGDTVRLDQLSDEELTRLRHSPGAALGSSRFKPTEEDLQRCVEHLQRMQIGRMFFMGGNGTMRGAGLFLEHCKRVGYGLQVVGVPKTIDNDIAATDRCSGIGSAGLM